MEAFSDFEQRQAERYARREERRNQERIRTTAAVMKLTYVVLGAATLYVMLFLGCLLASM